MKRSIALGLIVGLTSQACTTVHVTESAAISPIVETATAARDAIFRSTKTLFYVFSKENWCPQYHAGETQSAASILLQGLKKDRGLENNIDAYISSVASVDAVNKDMSIASHHVSRITFEANAFLNENPDLQSVKTELKTLEQALIASRQAEVTFSKAIETTAGVSDMAMNVDLSSYKTSVDELRSITDAYGQRMRGQADLLPAG